MKISLPFKLSGFLIWVVLAAPVIGWTQAPFENPLIADHDMGLAGNWTTKVVEDQDGFAWVGAISGLSRFDGTSIETFVQNDEDSTSLLYNWVIDILPDLPNEKIWVGNGYGLSVYNTKKKNFKNYYPDPDNPNAIPDHGVRRIIRDKAGQIWMGVQAGGLMRYRSETDDFERYLCFNEKTQSHDLECANTITDIQEDLQQDSIFWLGTFKGLLRFNKLTGEHTSYFFEIDDPVLERNTNNVRCMLVHPNGKIYYGTWWGGINVFDIQTKTFSKLDPCYQNGTEAFGRDAVSSFYKKSADEFWINSTKGLQVYSISTNCITQALRNEGKKWYSVEHIDRQGRIWSISQHNGFQIFNPLTQQAKVLNYEPPGTKYKSFTKKILEDTLNKKLLVASETSRGLFIYDQFTGQWECIPPPIEYNMEANGGFQAQDMISLDDGKTLIVEEQGLYYYESGFQRLKKLPLQLPKGVLTLRKILRDRDGKYWISSRNASLLKWDKEQNSLYSFREELNKMGGGNLGGDFLAEDIRGNIWMREKNGLLVYEKSKQQFIYHPYDPENIKAYREMGPIETDQNGNVWVASKSKLLGYGHADSLSQGLRFMGDKNEFIDDEIHMVKVYNNKLLLGGGNYLFLFNPETKIVEEKYAEGYGVGEALFSFNLLPSGQVGLNKIRGIALYNPDQLKTNEELPQAYVSSFSVFDTTWQLKNQLTQRDSIALSHKENFFSFEFSALGFNLPEEITFRYKLEGFDANWKDGTKRKFATYTNVPGGEYQFLVEAINSEGLKRITPSITYLSISTVWYKTYWFWGILIFSILALAYLFYRSRIRQVRKEERLQSEYENKLANVEMSALRAQMNPHFIFNSLNSIEYYIINNEPEFASDYLNRFSRLIRLILQNSKSTKVPLKDELEALKLYIEMESMRFDNLFDYEVQMEEGLNIEKISVPPMLVQPYVENAIWHGLMQKKGERGKINLTLKSNNGQLICLIEDNGIGRAAAQKLKSKSGTRRKSYGMKITSDRLAMLSKKAGVESSVKVFDLVNADGTAGGTRVELIIPLVSTFE